MKKLITLLIIILGCVLTNVAQEVIEIPFDSSRFYENGVYIGIFDDNRITFAKDSNGKNTIGFWFLNSLDRPEYSRVPNWFVMGGTEGDAKIEDAKEVLRFKNFDLTDAKVLTDLKLENQLVIARIGKNVFFGEYDPKSCVFNKAAIVDSEYAPQVDKAINDAINQGILISYLKPATAPQETQPVQQQQRPSRPTTGSTQKRK